MCCWKRKVGYQKETIWPRPYRTKVNNDKKRNFDSVQKQ